MEIDRLQNLLFLLGTASLATGCPDDLIPGEGADGSTTEDEDEDDDTSAGPSSATMSASGSSATMTGDDTTGTSPSTTSPSTTDPTDSSTTIVDPTETTSSTTEPPETTSSSTGPGEDSTADSTTTFGNDSTTTYGGFSTTYGGFTTYATFGAFTTGGYYFEECDAWAAQRAYCFYNGYYEAFFQYRCNQYIVPYHYSYGDACGVAGLALADCLSTLDCDEWENLGLGTDCDDELDDVEDNCDFPDPV